MRFKYRQNLSKLTYQVVEVLDQHQEDPHLDDPPVVCKLNEV